MKARTVGAKRRAKKGYRAICEQQERAEVAIQTREKDDPLKTVREARARQTGKKEADVMNPMLCFDAGRAIDAGARNRAEADQMWTIYKRFDEAHRASVFHSTGKPREPTVSRMEFMPERFETNADLPPIDLRSEQERHNAAMRRWDECKHILGFLNARERHAITDAFWQSSCLHQGGITVHGVTFVASMRVLCEVVDAVGRGK